MDSTCPLSSLPRALASILRIHAAPVLPPRPPPPPPSPGTKRSTHLPAFTVAQVRKTRVQADEGSLPCLAPGAMAARAFADLRPVLQKKKINKEKKQPKTHVKPSGAWRLRRSGGHGRTLTPTRAAFWELGPQPNCSGSRAPLRPRQLPRVRPCSRHPAPTFSPGR